MKKPQDTKTLLHQALGLNSQERTVLLEQIEDSEIKNQVETMLADQAQLQAFLQQQDAVEHPKINQVNHIEPGTLINRIRIIKLLGQGGMGSVYLGFDEKLERQVAVKSIRPEHLKNPATQQRFVREAQILSKINHSSICQLYDYIETAEGDFLVLEYIKGQPLYKVPMSDQQKLTILADLAAALAVAHEHGIVHRDLKPDNIMITDEGQLKVLDFGIAQSLSKPKLNLSHQTVATSGELTQHGSLVGTIRYMSPEQAHGLNIDTASDMYALGIIAQEVFSHKAAYQVIETEQLLFDVQQGNRLIPTDLPEPINKLVSSLTQLNPNQRPTALEAVAQVNAILLAPKLKRKKIIKYSIITAVVVLLTLLFWQWQQFGDQAVRNDLIKAYEGQINSLVKQAEQIYVLPIHPVNEEINSVLQQGEALYGKIYNDESLTEKDKQRLMGIILLEGESYEEAIPMLMAGQAENQLLADAWIMLYIEQATEFSDLYGMEQTLNDSVLRDNYLKPALKYIELAHADEGKVNPLSHAFVLSQTESLGAGLTAVNQILTEERWNKKAVNLKSLILSASMTHAREIGDWEQAKKYALMAADNYQVSTQMARSYPPGYISLCYVSLGLMADGIQRSGEQIDEFTEQSITACNNALTIQPDNKYVMQLLTRIFIMKAQWEVDLGINADETLSEAKAWNQKSSSLENLYNSSWTQASILSIEAKQLLLSGENAQPAIDQALELFNHLLKIESEYKPYVAGDMLYLLALQARDLFRKQQDPTNTYQQAQALFEATRLTPDLMVSEQWGLQINMAQVYMVELWHQFESQQNILPLGEKLLAFLNPSDSVVNDEPQQLITLANTHLLMAEYLRRQQQSPSDHLDLAAEYIIQAKKINPINHNLMITQASLLTLQGYFSNQDYTQANEIFAQVSAANPNNTNNQHAWAESLLIQAQKNQTKSQQLAALKMAHEKLQLALAVDAKNPAFINSQKELFELATKIGFELTP